MGQLDNQLKETMRAVMTDILGQPHTSITEIMDNFYKQTTVAERTTLHTDYRDIMWSTPIDFNNPLTINMSTILNEGLVRTYPIKKTVEYVKSYLHLHPTQIKTETTKTGATHIIIIIPNVEYNIYHVDNAMRLCGYFRSRGRVKMVKDKNNRVMEWVVMQYEAEFQDDSYSSELRQECSVLIHLTPYYNVDKIQAKGFVPRCKNDVFKYPERIYFLKGSASQQEINLVGRVLCHTNNRQAHIGQHLPKGYKEGDYAVIYVDLNKISNDVKFYSDPNMSNAVFTMENIPPFAIVKVEKRNYHL